MSSSPKSVRSSSERSPSLSPERSSSPPSIASELRVLQDSLDAASPKGDLRQVQTILQTWNSTPSLPHPTPTDLGDAMRKAVLYGHLAVVKLLLAHGAPITATTATMATRDDKPNVLAIFEAFLQHGWDVKGTTAKTGVMIMNLTMSNTESEPLLRLFLDNGAPPSGLPSNPGSPIRKAALIAKSAAIPSLLISRGATLKHTSALHAAAYRSDDEASITMMGCLLEAGADINELEYEGWERLPREAAHKDWGTALHTAAGKKGSLSKARFLVEAGADVEKKSKYGYTARDRAQIRGNRDIQTYLETIMIERGLEVMQLEIK